MTGGGRTHLESRVLGGVDYAARHELVHRRKNSGLRARGINQGYGATGNSCGGVALRRGQQFNRGWVEEVFLDEDGAYSPPEKEMDESGPKTGPWPPLFMKPPNHCIAPTFGDVEGMLIEGNADANESCAFSLRPVVILT